MCHKIAETVPIIECSIHSLIFSENGDFMPYQDAMDASRQYLRLALEWIGKYGLPTDPLNYCVWYEYVSGKNEALNKAIDEHLAGEEIFSEEVSRQFYDQYIANDEERVNKLVRGELRRVFKEIVSAIKTTNQHFSQSEDNLEVINDSIVPSLSQSDVEMIVDRIKREIKSLESSSSTFKEQLQQATREIDQLKMEMTRYRDEARKDPLTRIHNRRGFDPKLESAIDEANQSNTKLCLIMADIDHFKQINDSHGHLVGDNVLRMVAATIKNSIKGKDLVARIGGEEFAIMLPQTPVDGALTLAENIRRSFERLDLKKKSTGESLGKITLSFGVTRYVSGETAEDFLHRADKAMYRSKTMGRNKVTGG